MSFGKNILAHRLAKGYSREYVAVNCGMTVAALNSWETELRNPPLKKAKIIADFYGTTVSELMDLPEEKIVNMANVKLNPQDQSSIDRIKRMRDAGLTEEQIDKAINLAIELIQK